MRHFRDTVHQTAITLYQSFKNIGPSNGAQVVNAVINRSKFHFEVTLIHNSIAKRKKKSKNS